MEKLLLLAMNGLIWGLIIALIALGVPIISSASSILSSRATGINATSRDAVDFVLIEVMAIQLMALLLLRLRSSVRIGSAPS